MRLACFVIAACLLAPLGAVTPAEAQSYFYSTPQKRAQIVIKKRSYLDPGTVVKPGSQNYHDYAFGPAMRNPIYGPPGSETSLGGDRWPMLRWWEGY